MENQNKSLFWYGFRAKVKKLFGSLLIGMGIITCFISLANENTVWILGLIMLGFGIFLLAKGHSQRFDYKMQSGYMVHGGDR